MTVPAVPRPGVLASPSLPDLEPSPEPLERALRDRQAAAALQAAIEQRLGRRDRTLSADTTAAALVAQLEHGSPGRRQRY